MSDLNNLFLQVNENEARKNGSAALVLCDRVRRVHEELVTLLHKCKWVDAL
jgi:hypothetical protein